MKKTTLFTLTLLFSFGFLLKQGLAQDPASRGEAVSIPDPNLRFYIALELGKAEAASITVAEMETLTEFSADDRSVKDLTGIEFATNLTHLFLGGNQISDISLLAHLTNLTWLDLDDNQISDVSPLVGLSNLTHLSLSSNQISDVSPLTNLINLKTLYVDDNQISDVSPLAKLTNLKKLFLDINQISDVSPLAKLTNLTELGLSSNQISDVSPLAKLTNLTVLNLQSNQISDFSPTDRLKPNLVIYIKNLQQVNGKVVESEQPDVEIDDVIDDGLPPDHIDPSHLDEAHPEDAGGDFTLDAIFPVHIPDSNLRTAIEKGLGKTSGATISYADIRKLTDLRANKQGIQDLTGLEFATNLTQARLSNNQISDISVLAELTKLTELYLAGNQISDVSPLAGLTKLTKLILSSNQISDFSSTDRLKPNLVTYKKDLQRVGGPDDVIDDGLPPDHIDPSHLDEAHPEDAGGDFTLDAIFPVHIPDSNLRTAIEKGLGKISGATISYADIRKLTDLRANKQGIQDLTGLEFATNLTQARLSNNQISDISVLAELTKLTELYLAGNQISDVSPLAGLTKLTKLILSSNQISDFSSTDRLKPNLVTYKKDLQQVPVHIPDDSLREELEVSLRKDPDSPITAADMLTLTELDPSYPGIQDLTGLEFAKNLTFLRLPSSELSTLTPLAGLTNLTKLDLEIYELSDLTPLAGLTNLTELSIVGYELSDLTPLAGLTNLTKLEIHALGGELSDLTPLAGLRNLTELNVSDSRKLSDVSPLAGLRNLTKLGIRSCAISDVTPLAGLTNLTVLYLDYNAISDVSPLAGLTNLTQLDLGRNEISDVSPLSGLRNLTTLYLNDNQISDFSPIAGLIPNLTHYSNTNQRGLDTPVTIPDRDLRAVIEKRLGKTSGATITGTEMRTLTVLFASFTPGGKRHIQDLTGLEFAINLTKLDLLGNQISDLSPLTKLKNLTELDISKQTLIEVDGFYGNIIYLLSDLSPLAELKNLTSLSLKGNQISDISPLAELKNLTSLNLWSNRISDISPLTKLKNLIKLYLGGNRISDISPLAELKNLTSLSLTDNHQISDFSPLTKLKNLTSLSLKGNRISDISPLAELKNLTSLNLEGNRISDLSPLAELKNLTSLNLGGNLMSDLSPLTKLKNLTKLYLGYSHQISDYSPLLLLPRLSVVKGNGIDDIHALHAAITKTDGCTFNMPQTYGRLRPSTHVYSISRKPSQGGVSGNVGFVQSAPIVSDNATLNWTYKTTVASESEKDPTTITIEFLDGDKNEKDIVIEAARTWESFGYLHFKFLHPGQSGASDIRVKFEYNYLREVKSETKVVNGVEEIEYIPTGKTFSAAAWGTYEPPSENHGLLSFSDFRSYYGTLANERKGEATMFFTTNFGRSTALHELGHALGLTHEHLSPKFKDYFEWVDIEAVYTHFQSTQSWTREKVAGNVVNTVPVATNLPGVDFDPESVMTYGIPAKLIKARPNAPSWAKSAAINGIGSNFDLSEGDEKIMAVLYPKPRDFVVSGEITVHAMDDDLEGFPCFR